MGFREKTWFGAERSKKYNLCNTVGFAGSTCWIPSAPQKTYLNQDTVDIIYRGIFAIIRQ